MPTSVTTARQFLTQEAARVRRGCGRSTSKEPCTNDITPRGVGAAFLTFITLSEMHVHEHVAARTRPCFNSARWSFALEFHSTVYFHGNARESLKSWLEEREKSIACWGLCYEALRAFTESLKKGKSGFLDGDLAGLTVISIEKEIHEGKLDSVEIYTMFSDKFPNIEKDWDLLVACYLFQEFFRWAYSPVEEMEKQYLCPSSYRMNEILIYPKWKKHRCRYTTAGALEHLTLFRLLDLTCSWYSYSLMRSFVPFGGLFPAPSDLKSPLSARNQSIPRCKLCNDKYEQEVDAVMKAGSAVSDANQYQRTRLLCYRWQMLDKQGEDAAKTNGGESMLSAEVLGLQEKWNICRRLHHTPTFPKFGINRYMSRVPDTEQRSGDDLSIDESPFPNQSPSRQVHMEKTFLPKSTASISCTLKGRNMNFHSGLHVDVPSLAQQTDKGVPWFHHPQQSLSSCSGRTPSSFVPPVTTDLELGTIYGSTSQESNTTKLLNHKEHLHHFSGSVSAEFDANSETTTYQFAQSLSCSGPTSGEQFDLGDYKSTRKALAEKVGWQDEAINSVSQAVSQLRHRNRSSLGMNCKGGNWLTFLGPDRIGKIRIASALADILFGSQESLVSVDLSSQDKVGTSNSIFECRGLNGYDADYGVQHSLDMAIRTGKFLDSCGRAISINNMVLITSAITKSVGVTTIKEAPTSISANKRKPINTAESSEVAEERAHKVPRSCLDLNFPVDVGDDDDTGLGQSKSDSLSESSEHKKEALEDWISKVVGGSLAEAGQSTISLLNLL
ncbi:hypothetical protein F3Y22_tig00116997pilonHSYRG00299 [Hibiscus syriacus]|uniref:ATPase AAA-type core domain-containing protein n=1 Tax=Hibiscus syriacus TaxID=106335 RepID=A0A6A2WGA1_HIBSY|nr:hypothetical protein F3Y22_tig00116997pilonHSYRG00299 [Hibiscus syriacus]